MYFVCLNAKSEPKITKNKSSAPVAQSVAFTLPKTDCCWGDMDRIPLRSGGENEIEMKGLGT